MSFENFDNRSTPILEVWNPKIKYLEHFFPKRTSAIRNIFISVCVWERELEIDR